MSLLCRACYALLPVDETGGTALWPQPLCTARKGSLPLVKMLLREKETPRIRSGGAAQRKTRPGRSLFQPHLLQKSIRIRLTSHKVAEEDVRVCAVTLRKDAFSVGSTGRGVHDTL